jgi:putative transposase
MTGKLYKTDLSNEEWKIIEPLIPSLKSGGRPRKVNLRKTTNGIFYRLRTGCSCAMLPKNYGPHQTVYDYFNKWCKDETWKAISNKLNAANRLRMGKDK